MTHPWRAQCNGRAKAGVPTRIMPKEIKDNSHLIMKYVVVVWCPFRFQGIHLRGGHWRGCLWEAWMRAELPQAPAHTGTFHWALAGSWSVPPGHHSQSWHSPLPAPASDTAAGGKLPRHPGCTQDMQAAPGCPGSMIQGGPDP